MSKPTHPFVVGESYRNRKRNYTVVAIHDNGLMTVRFDDGTEKDLKIEIQVRIWQGIQDTLADELAKKTAEEEREQRERERLATAPVRDLVQEVIEARFSAPYPPDITDRVCLAIEGDAEWMSRYEQLCRQLEEQWIVNNAIGSWTIDVTGMVVEKENVKATTNLMQSYSRLTNKR